VFAPAGVPDAVMARLAAALQKALDAPEIRTRIAQLGGELQGGGPEASASFIRQQTTLWTRLVKERGISID
jgi:tripartite-type tricarboxylate transporter receptor subunit TctC